MSHGATRLFLHIVITIFQFLRFNFFNLLFGRFLQLGFNKMPGFRFSARLLDLFPRSGSSGIGTPSSSSAGSSAASSSVSVSSISSFQGFSDADSSKFLAPAIFVCPGPFYLLSGSSGIVTLSCSSPGSSSATSFVLVSGSSLHIKYFSWL